MVLITLSLIIVKYFMSTLYLLIPIGLALLVLAIKMLFWAINSGQYDDLDMEGHRILFDDDLDAAKKQAPQTQAKPSSHNETDSTKKNDIKEDNDK